MRRGRVCHRESIFAPSCLLAEGVRPRTLTSSVNQNGDVLPRVPRATSARGEMVSIENAYGDVPEDVDEAKVLLQRKRTKRSTLKRHVTWKEIDGACAELLQYQVPKSVELPVDESDAPPRCLFGCWAGFGGGPQPALAGHRRKYKGSMQPYLRPKKKKEGNYGSGHLWKLNADAGVDPSDLADLSNWRRRMFYLKEQHTGAHHSPGMFYMSEKANLEMSLACIFDTSSDWQIMNAVDLQELTAKARNKICSSAHSYDLAIGLITKKSAEYEEVVPDQLFPISVMWKDAHKCEHRLVVAASSDCIRQSWIDAIRRSSEGPHGHRRH